MADTFQPGKAFFRKPTGSPGYYSTWYGVGSLLIGWELSLKSDTKRTLIREWPFCSEHNSKVYLPIPGSLVEWKSLLRILKNLPGMEIPSEVANIALKAVQNGELRYELSHSPLMDKPLTIPGLKTPDGFSEPMFPFQEVAVRYVQSLGYRAMVGDDMGLGKTVVGIASALSYKSKRTIVVTRSVALDAWTRAIKRWTDQPVIQASGKSPLKKARKDGTFKIPNGCAILNYGLTDFDAGFVVINYEILSAWKDVLTEWNADFFVLDEVHAVKEPKSARSQAAYALMGDIPGVLGLTGTPINNRPLELYPLLSAIQPARWGNFFSYAMRYCDAHQKTIKLDWKNMRTIVENGVIKKVPNEIKAWDFSGSKRRPELYHRLRSNIMVRRLKDEVLSLLPPIEETIPLTPSDRYFQVENGELEFIDGLLSPSVEVKKKAETSLHNLFAAAAMDKIDWAKEWLEAFLEDTDQKIVIFFHYQRVGEALTQMLKDWKVDHVNLWGTKPERGGDHRFQTQDTCRVALCSYSTAREAVTLTEASYQLSLEYPWVPGWAEQARDRTRRIGQTKAVTYYYPVLVGSAEERIVKAMLSKQDIISVIMQGVHKKSIGLDTSVFSLSP